VWYVTTPDGEGLCWRCRWLPVDDAATALRPSQRRWVAAAGTALRDAHHPAAVQASIAPRPPGLTIEMFWAPPWSGARATMTWVEPGDAPDDAAVERAEAVAFASSTEIVAVCEDGRHLWMLPGGHREPGEQLGDALRRELSEEASADLLDCRLLGYQRYAWHDGPRAGTISYDAMYRALVELRPFHATHETRERRVMRFADARQLPLWANPITARLFERASLTFDDGGTPAATA
jgi:ADP-ribose pyrophosphatase YjhB (NUDIX family)